MEKVLEIKGLTKRYGRLLAVNKLSLEVPRGSVFGILGPNGSGKTTTLGILLDVIQPTAGDFLWFGAKADNKVRKEIGAILETPIFYPYLTAYENLNIVAEIKGADKSNIEKVLETVELLHRKDDKFKTYSLGMKQRLSIASALLNDPKVMILDEPTNGLDPKGIAEIRDIITKIARDGKTIILASHLLDEVQKVCSHFAVLQNGKLLYQGLVEDVSKGEMVVEVAANGHDLAATLEGFEGSKKVVKDFDKWVVSLEEGFGSTELNQYLHGKSITASHLLTQKKSLEKQFLEILEESNENKVG